MTHAHHLEPEYVDYDLPLTKSQVNIAIVQLKGPGPDDRSRAFLHGRETLLWRGRDPIAVRLKRFREITSHLRKTHDNLDLLVFPEYSLPVDALLTEAQRFADSTNTVVVLGSDVSEISDTNRIVNQCPVLIPNRATPVWVPKRTPSRWEAELVDPGDPIVPVFTWKAHKKEYRLVIDICFDFLDALRVKPPGDATLVRLVPMCSPDVRTFQHYADTIIADGTAVILANCTGGDAYAGKSAVYAQTPTGTRFKAALQLPHDKQGYAYFSLDCKHLRPSRRPAKDAFSCLSNIIRYDYDDTVPIFIACSDDGQNAHRTRAVLNPAIFRYLGKTMRIAFLRIRSYGDINTEQLAQQSFECFAVLGHHDIMVTHVHESEHDLFFEIDTNLNVESIDTRSQRVTPDLMPFFEVRRFYKVLGYPISDEHRQAFSVAMPTDSDIASLIALASDWESPDVLPQQRIDYEKHGWVLGPTDRQPGLIGAAMTIGIEAVGDIAGVAQDFRDRVLPKIIAHPATSSVFEGRGQWLQVSYVIRLRAEVSELFEFIEWVHDIASDARIVVRTDTFIIVSKLSALNLPRTLITERLSRRDQDFVSETIRRWLDAEEFTMLESQPEERKRDIVSSLRSIYGTLGASDDHDGWLTASFDDTIANIAKGLVANDIRSLSSAHGVLQGRVEDLVRTCCRRVMSDEDIISAKSSTGIHAEKSINKLSYVEWLKLTAVAIDLRKLPEEMRVDINSLLSRTPAVRNAFVHNEHNRVQELDVASAFIAYCNYLRNWSNGLEQ